MFLCHRFGRRAQPCGQNPLIHPQPSSGRLDNPQGEEIQDYANRNEWENIFAVTKAVYGPPAEGATTHLSVDETTLLTEKTQTFSAGRDASEAFLTNHQPSPTPSSTDCLM
ncbi:unnamed protein product [Schistocephalus solidus]|uniref:DDE_Tnp_1_7 domain-containing protein n=1 Tax=Schistocephalus solidus TaxID=70667 RepID=A0A183T8C5_SCHSO|nr:unnamed protein product [Schistocephalus solidus]